MPNYGTHRWLARKVGIVAGVSLAIATFLATFTIGLAVLVGFVAYYSTIVGGVLPDIDQTQPGKTLKYGSIPYKKLVALLRLVTVIAIFLIWGIYTEGGSTVFQVLSGVVLASVGIALVRAVPDILHRFLPGHRKGLHEWAFWGITSLFGMLLIQDIVEGLQMSPSVTTFLPLAVGIPIFLGTVTHITSDSVKTFVTDNVPEPILKKADQKASQLAPWVPKHKPVIADIPRLLRIAVDRRAPPSIRLFVLFTAAYGLMPLDLIPDGFLIIGWTEDLGLYLSLRNTVYNGYHHDEGIREAAKRTVETISLYISVVLLVIFGLIIHFFWVK